ncbi:MAG: 3-dehydroquinate synthase [Bacteroidetes bacterium]|nr:3-dehydroquinate synthase [Bacteroidota bacterium]
MQFSVSFTGGEVQYLLGAEFARYAGLVPTDNCIFITDDNIARLCAERLEGKKIIVIPAGEAHKRLDTVETIINELLKMGAQRGTYLVGVGGGVVTDIAGFVASVYMRGVQFGFIPTTLLGMVDASIGGKNGVDVGLYKNVAGSFRQPQFILYDTSFLVTLPDEEWRNGFAEIIKYACVFDKDMFDELARHDISFYRSNEIALQELIAKCVDIKNKVVLADETEQDERKLLNFGHTLGHAIENMYALSHGQAISIGMVAACFIAEDVARLDVNVREQLSALLNRYGLPITIAFDITSVMDVLMKDKKRLGNQIGYILPETIGHAVIHKLTEQQIRQGLKRMQDAIGR